MAKNHTSIGTCLCECVCVHVMCVCVCAQWSVIPDQEVSRDPPMQHLCSLNFRWFPTSGAIVSENTDGGSWSGIVERSGQES